MLEKKALIKDYRLQKINQMLFIRIYKQILIKLNHQLLMIWMTFNLKK